MPRRSDGAAEVGGTRVEAGKRARVAVPVARLATGEWLALPVEVLNGSGPGPWVWLSGAIHGDELDGADIIRRVLSTLSPGFMNGVLLGIPVVNVFGFVAESRYLPDRRDLNRSFPGSARGSLASRLAHLFMTEVVKRCAFGVDFHCGSDERENLPQVRGNLDDPQVQRLALAFGAPVTIHGRPPDGSLRKAATAEGAKTLLYEGGEAGRFTDTAIDTGVAGTLRVLAALGMIPAPDDGAPRTIESRSTSWVRAPRSGVCRLSVELGQEVAERDRLGTIADLLGEDEESVFTRKGGIVIGRRVNPLVYQGEAVVHLAQPLA